MAHSEEHSAEPDLRYNAPIHEWAVSERPREKLLERGAGALSDAELLALIFGSGTRTRNGHLSAVQLGRALLRAYESLHGLSKRDHKEMMQVDGIGPAKAAQLKAAFEIGRRVESQQVGGRRVQVSCPEDVVSVYGPRLRDLKNEVFVVVHLSTSNGILGDETISEGGLASSIVEPRAVFRRAILENAAAVICLHNHPSGNPEPSRKDLQVTRQLVESGKLMGIPVHDHIIIAGATYTSLAERGVMESG